MTRLVPARMMHAQHVQFFSRRVCIPNFIFHRISHRTVRKCTKQKWLGPAAVLAQEMGRSQVQHEEAHGAVWIVVQGRLLRCAPEHLRHLSERESLSIDRDKGDKETRMKLERSLTLFRISFSRKAHTLIFKVSMILLMDPSRDTSAERFSRERQHTTFAVMRPDHPPGDDIFSNAAELKRHFQSHPS